MKNFTIITLTENEYQRVHTANRVNEAIVWAELGAQRYGTCFVYDNNRHTVIAEVTEKMILVY